MRNSQEGEWLRRATILFDLDGTIADTSRDLIAAANAALLAENLPTAPDDAIKKDVGRGAKAMLAAALAANGLYADPDRMQRLAERFMSHYEVNIAAETRFFPGFLKTAWHLREKGAKLVVCTNKPERLALRLLDALDPGALFDVVAGRDTFPFSKPDPRHLTLAIERAGGQISSALMIGDSEVDVAAAKAAQIPVIAVRFGYAFVPAESLGATAILDRFEELPAMVHALLGPQAGECRGVLC